MLSARRWLIPSYGTILVLAALSTALILRSAHLFSWDGDVGRHIRVGLDTLEARSIPFTDVYSHAAGIVDTYPYEWLSQVLYAVAEAVGGLPGAAVLAALLFAGAVFGAFQAAQELGAPRPLALLVGLMALLLQSIHLLPRPHLLTTALTACFMVLLLRFARTGHRATLAWLPALMVVWANAHPGFLIGFVVLGGFVVGAALDSSEFVHGRRMTRPLVLTAIACFAASLANPAGIGPWVQSASLLGSDFIMAVTNEFQSVDFHTNHGKLFFVVLFAGPVLWMTGRVKVTWLAGGFYLVFAAASLYSVRYVPLFTVTALPWLAVWIDGFLETGGRRTVGLRHRLRAMSEADRRLRPWLWIVAGLALVASALGPMEERYRFDASFFPIEAVDNLGSLTDSGRLFNQMYWGGYLLYVRPDVPIFIDGMSHIYGEQLAREYLTIVNGQAGWQQLLDRYGITWTLTAVGAPVNQLLALDPEWEFRYGDSVATIYVRRHGP